MKYYILDYSLNKEQRKYLESKGFNCYDLRDSCFYGDNATEYKYEEIQDYLDNCWDLRNKNEDLDL